MEVLIFSETLVSFYQTTQQKILREDSTLSPVWELTLRLLKRTLLYGSVNKWNVYSFFLLSVLRKLHSFFQQSSTRKKFTNKVTQITAAANSNNLQIYVS